MRYWSPRVPNRNVFNSFEKGKSFFVGRCVLEAVLALSAVIGISLVVIGSYKLYPVHVRSTNGMLVTGKPESYSVTPEQMTDHVRQTIEGLFLKTDFNTKEDKESVMSASNSFVLPELVTAVQGGVDTRRRFTQSALVTSLFFERVSPGYTTAVFETEFTVNTEQQAVYSTGYFQGLWKRLIPTEANPSGYVLTQLQELPLDVYREKRKQVLKDDAELPGQQNLLNLSY